MKICSKCKIEKEITFFGLLKKSKDGHRSTCKDCRKIERFEQSETFQIYYETNKITIREKARIRGEKYRAQNRNKINENRRNNLKYKKTMAAYQLNNKESIREKGRIYRRNKLSNDPVYKIQNLVSARIRLAIKKNGSISKYLNYSIVELKNHLESLFEPWMTWQNHGKYNAKVWDDNNPSTWTWQIDHIIPHSIFEYTSMEDDEFKLCWALSNLRPLSAKLNCIEGSKRTRHKNENFNTSIFGQ